MHPIVAKEQLSPNVYRLVVEAARIAEIRKPGQFVIVRRGPGAERIPLTIADVDPKAGTITLVIQAVGKSTHELTSLEVGDAIQDIAGPLGNPTKLLEKGHAVVVGGGVGTAVAYPIAQALSAAGVKVTSIIGGRSKEWVIYEDELRKVGEVVVCTDDGSYGRPGFVTEALKDACEAGGIKTTVSLNSIMIDGTGMCGGCRVSIGGKTEYACCDGPEFDGHEVDFRLLADRLNTYREFEQEALEKWAAAHPEVH